MSAIRFIHADNLRLGTPLSGLADSPTWLQRLAIGAVRQSVRNIIDVAISRRADFVLIAGTIADSKDYLEPAATWLRQQFESLRDHNIRVVGTADSSDVRHVMESVCDVVLGPNQYLTAAYDEKGTTVAASQSGSRPPGPHLIVDICPAGTNGTSSSADLVYRAVPSQSATLEPTQSGRDGRLTASAGTCQGTSPVETGPCGCLIVDANLSEAEIKSSFYACDVIQYCTETLRPQRQLVSASLAAELVNASDLATHSSPQTKVVDWILKSDIVSGTTDVHTLEEHKLLAALRSHLHSGHQGLWPRAITVHQDSHISLQPDLCPAAREFTETHRNQSATNPGHHKVELLAGLTLLSRAV